MATKNLSIDLLRTDGGTQMRAELTQEVYLDYRDKWIAGVEFDPVDVFYDGSTYWLADGFHRFYGAREAKRASIPCRIHNGTQRDAILFACGANAEHGLRRTNPDKRRAVEALLNDEEWCKWSDNKLAEKAAVSVNFVGVVRKQLSSDDSSPVAKSADQPRVGRDGKKRRPPAQKPKKLPSQSDAPPTPAEDEPPEESNEQTLKTFKDSFEFGNNAAEEPKAGEAMDLAAKQVPYDAMLNAITLITKTWNAVVSDERDGVYAIDKRQRVEILLRDLRGPIAQARPHAVCSHCAGNGCRKCQNCGWWPRSVVEGLRK